MELRHLRYFVAVAEELSFTRAAERLHIGQPPLSQQIQALEEEIGAILFDRSKRSIRLTEAGRTFLQDAQKILALSASAADAARRVERGEMGELKIGFIKSAAFTPIFPKIINAYRRKFPKVNLVLREIPTLLQVEALHDYALDIGFIRPLELDVPPNLALMKLQNHQLAVFLPEKHRLATAARIDIGDLRNEEFIMIPRDEGTTLNPYIFRLCTEAGFEPKVVMEAREAATIIGLVAAGCGISILPEVFGSIDIKGTRLRLIESAQALTHFALVRRANEPSALTRAFFDIAEEVRGAMKRE
ncbi:transcriptional regulator, LysR family [Noviherbaspirillum humi]|uniref:Transcriptional regulator, LysR family n=1 Tax=Noviherbaspirillum humi TaxID=1688639 RepID=A0A239LCB5_9BURK|nr:LysR substrate-binding domain-containing protein [Noviherbaspirillum humi]SNT27940.1 transcriptional regulator, LysR family [Noviherbaspirillum humi]